MGMATPAHPCSQVVATSKKHAACTGAQCHRGHGCGSGHAEHRARSDVHRHGRRHVVFLFPVFRWCVHWSGLLLGRVKTQSTLPAPSSSISQRHWRAMQCSRCLCGSVSSCHAVSHLGTDPSPDPRAHKFTDSDANDKQCGFPSTATTVVLGPSKPSTMFA